jgi:hypothetical protein
MGVLTPILSVVLYTPGCFFFYPWKPFLQVFAGDTYETAYRHFRRDHSDATNLCLHLVALVWQLLGNFGMLAALDGMLRRLPTFAQTSDDAWVETFPPYGRPLSTFTASMWILTLFLSPAPSAVTISSICGITSAFYVAPHLRPRELEMGMLGAFFVILILSGLVCERKTIKGAEAPSLVRDLLHAIKMFGLAAAMRLAGTPWGGTLSGSEGPYLTGLVALMVLLGALPKPTVPCVIGGMLFTRLLAELSGQADWGWLIFYGQAFVAQLSQGVAHDVSKQKATLLSHEDDSTKGRTVKLAFEISHCTYFPNLLLQSVFESVAKSTKST